MSGDQDDRAWEPNIEENDPDFQNQFRGNMFDERN